LKMKKSIISKRIFIMLALLLIVAGTSFAQRQMESLNRGLVAIPAGSGYFVSWRLLGTETQDTSFGFNVYKGSTKLNSSVITNATSYQDNSSGSGTYTVRPVTNGTEGSASEGALVLSTNYLNIPLSPPSSGTTPDGVAFTQTANDCSIGDLDGDGEYEIVLKWDPSNSKDNSQSGYTGDVFLDAYKLNGTRLWRIDLGINIRAGAHYTQFMVYDLDGDGKAEVACKTAPGTKDSSGAYLSNGPAASDSDTTDYRNSSGYVLSGPEYLTIFNGQTGREMVTTNYNPPRGTVGDWGDTYGNRVDRFLACIAYLDGTRPSLVMCRGYYTRATLWALDWRNGTLSQRWFFDSNSSGYSGYAGQGCHSLRVGDVDGDGMDEIVYGACTIDHDGRGLYTTGLGHGDALHMTVMDPARSGLQVWQAHEDEATNGNIAASYRDARTGQVIWSCSGTSDNGRGMAAPLESGTKGWQMWSASPSGLFDTNGSNIGTKPGPDNFAMWWDGQLTRDLEDGTSITAFSGTSLLSASGCASNNSTKSTPCLTADIFGDWREEVIYRTSDNTALHIYTTTTATTNRLYTLMHDPVYRLSVASENVAYNQPPEPGIYIGPQMTLPETKPNITLAGSVATPVPTAVPTTAPTNVPTGTKGDVNGSGTVDIVDALLIAQYYVGLNPANFNSTLADVNCSGGIDIVDALLVAQRYVGLISSFPC
jgi:rhamnogalacturonan endolyase